MSMVELLQLIEREIPDGRKHLQDSHTNLERVASYCEENYLRATDKRHALEETKNYTTQSLASVAYQINTLATNFLHLLDLQMNQMAEMESSVNHLSQTVMIHKEKVARREIGVLTTNKTTTRPPGVKNPGIIFPDQPERPVKYVRRAIDYASLDDMGHGVKSAQQQNPRTRRNSSTSSKSGNSQGPAAGVAGQAPTTRPPTPPGPTIYSRTGTLTRQSSNSPYRSPAPPVSPPSLPSHYAPNYPKSGMGVGVAPQGPPPQAGPPTQPQKPGDRKSGYAAVKSMPVAPQGPPPAPPTGMVQPIISGGTLPGGGGGYASRQSMMTQELPQQQQFPPATPPPPPPTGVRSSYNTEADLSFPPVPDADMLDTGSDRPGNVSPPLPPHPDHGMNYDDHLVSLPPPTFDPDDQYGADFSMRLSRMDAGPGGRTQQWVPSEYIEKVVSIFEYAKDKEDELSFSEGAVIYVLRKNDDGWWEGVMDGVTGLFPCNYVERCI